MDDIFWKNDFNDLKERTKQMDDIFWKNDFNGKAKGLFIRSSINNDIKKLIDKWGLNVVGIKIDPDGGWNTELIIEDESGIGVDEHR